MEQRTDIYVRGLTHVYGWGRTPLVALEALDLQVDAGSFVSVIGPSGAGKTTLLKSIAGLLEPTEGTVRIGGASPEQAQREKRIGYLSQEPSLLPWRTVFQNIGLGLELNSDGTGGDDTTSRRFLHAVGLAGFENYHPYQLSGGMKQRAAFARALAMDPDVLLLDEPLGALDEITRAAMRYELLRLWETSHKTVLLVTHSVPEAIMMSDRVIVMSPRPGRILGQVGIDLPRPREESYEESDLFLKYAGQVRAILNSGASHGTPPIEAWARS